MRRREVVRHDAPETRRDVVEERPGVEVRDERVVDLEQHPEPVALLPETPFGFLRALLMERVVDRERDLVGELLQEFGIHVVERIGLAAREAERAEPAHRRRQRKDAKRPRAVASVRPATISGNRVSRSTSGTKIGCCVSHATPAASASGGTAISFAGSADPPAKRSDHLAAHGIVEDDGEPVEAHRLLQHDDELAEEAVEVAPRCREPRDVEEQALEVDRLAPLRLVATADGYALRRPRGLVFHGRVSNTARGLRASRAPSGAGPAGIGRASERSSRSLEMSVAELPPLGHSNTLG